MKIRFHILVGIAVSLSLMRPAPTEAEVFFSTQKTQPGNFREASFICDREFALSVATASSVKAHFDAGKTDISRPYMFYSGALEFADETTPFSRLMGIRGGRRTTNPYVMIGKSERFVFPSGKSPGQVRVACSGVRNNAGDLAINIVRPTQDKARLNSPSEQHALCESEFGGEADRVSVALSQFVATRLFVFDDYWSIAPEESAIFRARTGISDNGKVYDRALGVVANEESARTDVLIHRGDTELAFPVSGNGAHRVFCYLETFL